MNLGLDMPEDSPETSIPAPSLGRGDVRGITSQDESTRCSPAGIPGSRALRSYILSPGSQKPPEHLFDPPPSEQAEVLAAPRETLGGLR
ncbi:unnamed protein product, partial [Rangifer tarandus platyrhynchus]